MYSILLTTLMSVGPTTPEWGWLRNGCNGCSGCYGGSGCYGSSASYGCNGCTGGGIFGFRSRYSGCSGCYGSYGGCFGTSSAGPSYGVPFGYPIGPPAGVGVIETPVPVVPGLPPPQLGEAITPPPGGGTILPPAGLGETPAPPALAETQTPPNQVQVVVTLPADARLLVDGQPLALTGAVRVFQTPPLNPNQDYYYELTMEVDRGGRTVRRSQTVWFRVGKVARVEFAEPGPDAAGANTARIHVTVPEGAALYVEGRPWALTAGGPTILTPPLDPGRTHYYLLRVVVEHDGRREVRTREVAFRAGQDVTVDMTEPATANVAKR